MVAGYPSFVPLSERVVPRGVGAAARVLKRGRSDMRPHSKPPLLAVLSLGLDALVAAPPGCHLPGATVSSNASWAACFSLTEQQASSLRECMELCGAGGMTPACLGSTEENAFARGLLQDDDSVWIGRYQDETDVGVGAGWGRCVAGKAPGFINWDEEMGQPSGKHWGLQSDCVSMAGGGKWYDIPCVLPAAFGLTLRCLCEGPSSPSTSFDPDLVILETTLETEIHKHEARVPVVSHLHDCCVSARLAVPRNPPAARQST